MNDFKCEKCGYCCTLRVRLSLLEFLKIYFKGKRNFSEKGSNNKRYIKIENNKCFFLTKKDKKPFCKIYQYRPKMCREYPGDIKGTCKESNPDVIKLNLQP